MTKYMRFMVIIFAALLLLPAALAYDVDINTYVISDGDGFLSDNTVVTVTGTDLEDLTVAVTDGGDVVYFEDLSTGTELSVSLSTLSSSFSSSDLLTLGFSFTEGTSLETGTMDIMSDFVTPVFTWTSSQDTSFSSDTPTIYFGITDDQSTSFLCDIYLDSVLLLADQSYGSSAEFETFASSIADGDHEVYFDCVDEALNQNLENVLSFSVDTEAPVVSLVTADAGTTNDDTFLVEFIPEDNLADELTCGLYVGEVGDDLELEESDSYTSGESVTSEIAGLIIEGEFQYVVVCTDDAENAGTSTTQTFSVVDATAPVIVVSSPSESEVYDLSDPTVTVTSTITDDFSSATDLVVVATITYPDGTSESATATPTGDIFEGSLTLDSSSQDGWYFVTMDATDLAGNTVSSVVNFAFDNAASDFTSITFPTEVSSYDDLAFVIEVTDTVDTELDCQILLDDSIMRYGIGGIFSFTAEAVTIDTVTTLSISEDEWDTIIAMDPMEGDHDFSVSCDDDAGHDSTTGDTAVFVDSGPVVEITSPAEFESFGDAYVDGTSTIDITYEITDFIEDINSPGFSAVPEVEGIISDSPIVSADGTYSYILDVTGYADQYILLYAESFDDAGNFGFDEFIIYIDTGASAVTITDSSTLVGQSSSDITVESSGEAGFYTVYVVDSESNVVGQTTTTEASTTEVTVSVDFSGFSNEEETFSVYMIDDAGNSGSGDAALEDEFTTYIDATAATVSSFTCSDVTVGASSDCTCSATDDATAVALGSTVTTVVTGDDTDVAGTITAVCTATDSQGNIADLSEVDFTVSAAVSASGSSGGGGGGSGSSSRSECEDGLDNDGDGLFDLDDPGCSNRDDDSEEDVVCTESWTCTAYSVCSEDGSQDRNCYDANACEFKESRGQVDVVETSAMPDESRSCTVEATTTSNIEAEDPVVEEQTQEEANSGNLLTGAITGVFDGNFKSLAKPAVIIFAIAVLVGLGIFARKKFK